MDRKEIGDLVKSIQASFTSEELSELFGRSLLSDKAIKRHMELGSIVIEPFEPKNLGTVSYDVTLGENYFREANPSPGRDVLNPYCEEHVRRVWKLQKAETAYDIAQKANLDLTNLFGKGISQNDKVIMMSPGETILGHTNEFIGGRKNVTTMMKARSSLGRNFIEICKCAGWGDVGYVNRWTLEITNNSNYHHIPVVVGRRIGQLVFFEVEPILNKDYTKTGKYCGSLDVEELKIKWTPEEMLPKMWKDREVVG
ncbi:MAG: hypothetical protein AABX39_03565, partial [Nanoarchaeota archaeon]